MNNDRCSRGVPVGLVTLLVIFAALCLTILSVLSYSTAKYEKTLSRKNADSASAYYKADAWCTDAANDIYWVWKQGGDLAAAADKCGGTASLANGEYTVSFARAVDSTRRLRVTIRAGESFEVTRWNTSSESQWSADDSIEVWNPAGDAGQ